MEICSSADEGSGWSTQKLLSRDNFIEDMKTKLTESFLGALLMWPSPEVNLEILRPWDIGTLRTWDLETLRPWDFETFSPWNLQTLRPSDHEISGPWDLWDLQTLRPSDLETLGPSNLQPFDLETLKPCDIQTLRSRDPEAPRPSYFRLWDLHPLDIETLKPWNLDTFRLRYLEILKAWELGTMLKPKCVKNAQPAHHLRSIFGLVF